MLVSVVAVLVLPVVSPPESSVLPRRAMAMALLQEATAESGEKPMNVN